MRPALGSDRGQKRELRHWYLWPRSWNQSDSVGSTRLKLCSRPRSGREGGELPSFRCQATLTLCSLLLPCRKTIGRPDPQNQLDSIGHPEADAKLRKSVLKLIVGKCHRAGDFAVGGPRYEQINQLLL